MHTATTTASTSVYKFNLNVVALIKGEKGEDEWKSEEMTVWEKFSSEEVTRSRKEEKELKREKERELGRRKRRNREEKDDDALSSLAPQMFLLPFHSFPLLWRFTLSLSLSFNLSSSSRSQFLPALYLQVSRDSRFLLPVPDMEKHKLEKEFRYNIWEGRESKFEENGKETSLR